MGKNERTRVPPPVCPTLIVTGTMLQSEKATVARGLGAELGVVRRRLYILESSTRKGQQQCICASINGGGLCEVEISGSELSGAPRVAHGGAHDGLTAYVSVEHVRLSVPCISHDVDPK